MIVGMFLRNYKVYKGLNFIPISVSEKNSKALFIGNNGVGKSSVLEAVDTFFNNEYWNVTKGSKKIEAFIAPIFMIEKIKINELLSNSPTNKDDIEKISQYFWNVERSSSSMLTDIQFNNFFNFRNKLKENFDYNNYYLFLVNITYYNKNKYDFASFTNDLSEKHFNGNPPDISFIYDLLMKLFCYIYIPIETTTKSVLQLETREMQELMSKDIIDEITKILNNKTITKSGVKINIVELLNDKLNNYMENINKTVVKFDPSYAFKVEGRFKKNLTALDFRDKILEAYFSIRTLKKDNKEIEELSSGEQRMALIDIIVAFLMEKDSKRRSTILAIDEPEASLHISKCFSQYKKLENISCLAQLLLTSHWYGALPIIEHGTIIHLEKTVKNNDVSSKYYEFKNYFEERKSFPDDIMLKSYFELVSAIVTILKNNEENWIICEGSDDKEYMEFYLKDKIPNLKIFTVGGSGNIKKIFEYLYNPFEEKTEGKTIKGKLLCIIDSDKELKTTYLKNETENKRLRIARIESDCGKCELKDLINKGNYQITEIEDCLNPKYYFDSLRDVIYESASINEKNAINLLTFNKKAKDSRVKNEDSILLPSNNNYSEFIKSKKIIYEYIDKNDTKYKIAKKYVKCADKNNLPEIFKLILNYFN